MPGPSDDDAVTSVDVAFYERVAARVAGEQVVSTYLDLGATAFDACVHSFMSGAMSAKERKCVSAVSKKFLAHHARVTSRFTEAQADYTKTQLAEARAAQAEIESKVAELQAAAAAKRALVTGSSGAAPR